MQDEKDYFASPARQNDSKHTSVMLPAGFISTLKSAFTNNDEHIRLSICWRLSNDYGSYFVGKYIHVCIKSYDLSDTSAYCLWNIKIFMSGDEHTTF